MVGSLNLKLLLQHCFHLPSPGWNVYKVSKAEDSFFSLFLSLSSFLSFLLCHFLPFPSELAALNVGHWEVRPSPPQPLSTLAPLSPWLRKNAACTALAVFYLSSSPLHVGLTSKSWRSWMRTLAGDLPIIRSFKKKKRWKKDNTDCISYLYFFKVSLNLLQSIIF